MTLELANATNLTGIIVYGNTVYNGFLGILLVILPSLILFGATVRHGEAKAGMASLGLCMISTAVFWALGLVNTTVASIFVFVSIILIVLLKVFEP